MAEPVHYYFAYGSNMNPARVIKRRMQFESAASGVLAEYSLRFNKRSTKFPGMAAANVVRHGTARTEGVVYRLSEPGQIKLMDPFEGYPVRYDRLVCPILIGQDRVDAWVYVANEDHVTEGLLPARWYLDHLLAGKDFLSPDYYEWLCQIECLPESETEPA